MQDDSDRTGPASAKGRAARRIWRSRLPPRRWQATRSSRAAPFFSAQVLAGSFGAAEANTALIEGLRRAGLD